MSRHVRPSDLKPSPLSRRIVRRMRKSGFTLLESDDNYALQGQSAGRHQKAAGGWAWELYVRRGKQWMPMSIGSAEPASSLRKHHVISSFNSHGDTELCFEKPNSKGETRAA